jgi:predicted XRE-type DNA-binding protein
MRKTATKRNDIAVKSSGNVFADLGLPNADERQTKVRLAVAINNVLLRRGLSQSQASQQLGINQPKISALSKYRLQGFSVERLMRFLTLLNQDVEIVIRNKPGNRSAGRVFVTAA